MVSGRDAAATWPSSGCWNSISKGTTHVLDADIKGFFDNIPHEVIMAGVAAEVADGNILADRRTISQGRGDGGWRVLNPPRMGTPQGGVISPLLANIALNSLDWQLHNAGFRFVRYADDFVVLCESEAKVKEAHELVQQQLTRTRPHAECRKRPR